jgi:glutamate racemase
MKEIMSALPEEDLMYLGDTARVPYGGRSPETVLRYSEENAAFLVEKGIKMLVVACNTSSAVGLDHLREKFDLPVIGVVEPGARAAVRRTQTGRVAVIATETTISSGSYTRAIRKLDPSITVTGLACPLFVPLIEEGWIDNEVTRLTAGIYLSSLGSDSIDTLVLGCTHYPMIKEVIAGITGVALIDSAVETAAEVRRVLEENGLMRKGNRSPSRRFFVTDAPSKFARIGERFLGRRIDDISHIPIGL